MPFQSLINWLCDGAVQPYCHETVCKERPEWAVMSHCELWFIFGLGFSSWSRKSCTGTQSLIQMKWNTGVMLVLEAIMSELGAAGRLWYFTRISVPLPCPAYSPLCSLCATLWSLKKHLVSVFFSRKSKTIYTEERCSSVGRGNWNDKVREQKRRKWSASCQTVMWSFGTLCSLSVLC